MASGESRLNGLTAIISFITAVISIAGTLLAISVKPSLVNNFINVDSSSMKAERDRALSDLEAKKLEIEQLRKRLGELTGSSVPGPDGGAPPAASLSGVWEVEVAGTQWLHPGGTKGPANIQLTHIYKLEQDGGTIRGSLTGARASGYALCQDADIRGDIRDRSFELRLDIKNCVCSGEQEIVRGKLDGNSFHGSMETLPSAIPRAGCNLLIGRASGKRR
jgi:hypothetical protein